MVVIGLCGSSGAGKGYVSNIFEKYGIPCIDTDKLYREKTTKKGTACLDELTKEFGNGILTEDGELNRTSLAAIVFEGEDAKDRLSRLNEIAHKYIKIDTEEILAENEANGKVGVVIDAPVLFESGFDKMCDITVAVVAPYEKKLERIISRDKITKEKAEARLKSQLSDNELIKRTTYQIDNSSIDVEAQIIEILKKEQIYEKEC